MGYLQTGQRNLRHQRDARSGSAALHRNRSGAGCAELRAGHHQPARQRGDRDRHPPALRPDAAEISDNTRIVIIEADKQVVGIMVDSVAEVVYLRQSEIETAPNVGNEESAKFIRACATRTASC
jgi:hypothetical protein